MPLLLAATLLAVACQPKPDPEAQRAAREAAREQAAEVMAAQFDAAIDAQNWQLARAHGDVLIAEYPGSEAAERIQAQHADVKAKAEAASEARRTAALWTYQSQPVDGGEQLSAAIHAKDRVDVDGSGPQPVRLIFRDHPDWGRSSYLVLQAGDFDCYGGCKVQVTVDDSEPRAMDASRPDTDEAIAMFIEDERALWNLAKDADEIAIEFPVKVGGTRTVVYEVAGLDSNRLPAWN
ncbi:hypothetical protein [Lysobacter sp. D1-1-M9]|uniref:hypothetical protein n=1 Tax=Novilysobacter longmucuonensis TaxID=3098603 RepID=UPI0039834317